MIPSSLRDTFPASWFRALVASTVGGAILISGCGGDAGGPGSVDLGKAKQTAAKKGIARSRAAAAHGGQLKGITAVARLGDIKRTKNGRR